jgi:serine/threonine protein kinase
MPPKKIDSGGQGQIYEVDKDTVYKTISFSEHYKELSELAILHSLSHPCMIRMKKWELTQTGCKVYMERMHSNMYDYAKKVSFEKRLELFPNILWSMVRVARFFQKNGIMNCDIKSENVMLSKDGHTVKIIDFGHIISEEKYPIIGTRSYQPPELWRDDVYSYKSMVWAIGLSSLEFLYRIHPIVDIIYGEDSDSEYSGSFSKSSSRYYSGSSDGSDDDFMSDSNEDDMYRQKYTNLFDILMEAGESLPFRHRLEPVAESIRDKVRVINSMLERMLTYDTDKRISLDELYHHRIFDNIRGDIKDEPVMTKTRDQLYCDRELTPIFMNVGRKLYREEIMIHSYMLVSLYLEKKQQQPSKQEFILISLACLDIMSYVFSMVPSSRDLHRKIILQMRKISEHQLFEKAIDIIKSVQFNIFYHGLTDVIKRQDQDVVYALLLELIEWEAEQGKRSITTQSLLDRYMSSEFIEDEKEDVPDDAQDPPDVQLYADPMEKKKSKQEIKEITESDINPHFLQEFKDQIRRVHEEELARKRQEEEYGDVLIIEL